MAPAASSRRSSRIGSAAVYEDLLIRNTNLNTTRLRYSSFLHPCGTQREDEHERAHKHGNTGWLKGVQAEVRPTSDLRWLHTTKQQRKRRRLRWPTPLSVVKFGQVHRLLVLLLVVFGSNQPLTGKVFKDDVIIANRGRGRWRLLLSSHPK